MASSASSSPSDSLRIAAPTTEELLKTLSLDEKVALLSCRDTWHAGGVRDIKLIRLSDGPNGVRGQFMFVGTPALCWPCGPGLAASFDLDLIERVGQAIGQDCRAKGVHVLLGPTVNGHRHPLGGRNFEGPSEDPRLCGLAAAAFVRGVQSEGVAACVKHFLAAEQEHERASVDVLVSSRTLRELYIEPFRLAIKHGRPRAIMAAYQRVNGVHYAEHSLLSDVLRHEFGFDGVIMSDWAGTYSTSAAIKAGLDLEAPGPSVVRSGALIERAIGCGKLTEPDIDACVRRILDLAAYAESSGIAAGAPEHLFDTPSVRVLMREAASSAVVLLKNDRAVLPLCSSSLADQQIAVIGSNASIAAISGGGAAELRASYTVTPLGAIEEEAHAIGASVAHTPGVMSSRFVPLLPAGSLRTKAGESGLLIELWRDEPADRWLWSTEAPTTQPIFSCVSTMSLEKICDGLPKALRGRQVFARVTASYTPSTDGSHTIGFGSSGLGTLFANEQLLIENATDYTPGPLFFGRGSTERHADIDLRAGQPVLFEIRLAPRPGVNESSIPPHRIWSAFRLGSMPALDERQDIERAVELARASAATIVVVGLSSEYETEHIDRDTIALPGATNELVAAVLAVCPSAVIVTQSGAPISMPWIDQASTVVHQFLAGNEIGHGLADVLFGRVNPSGKMPITLPVRVQDVASHGSFGRRVERPGTVNLAEGVMSGYRHFDAHQIRPLFPFGHGLSYTPFTLSHLSTGEVSHDAEVRIDFQVANVGSRTGSEAVQVYVSGCEPTLLRPVKELKAFVKVKLEAGATRSISIELDREAFSYWSERDDAWRVDEGDCTISIGTSSASIALSASVYVPRSFTWRGL